MKRFVVIGLGNFGSSIAEALHANGHDVIAIDPNEEAVDRIAPHVSRAAVGDGRNIQTLERVGTRGADAGVVSTGGREGNLSRRGTGYPCASAMSDAPRFKSSGATM